MPDETYTYKGRTVRLEYDQDYNPYTDQDQLGTILTWNNRVKLGERDNPYRTPAEFVDWIALDPDALYLPIYVYNHSGVTIRTTPFNDYGGWDSGLLGYIYATGAAIRANDLTPADQPITADRRASAASVLVAEVAEIDAWLQGDCSGYVITGPGIAGEDSVWGFGTRDWARAAANDVIDALPPVPTYIDAPVTLTILDTNDARSPVSEYYTFTYTGNDDPDAAIKDAITTFTADYTAKDTPYTGQAITLMTAADWAKFGLVATPAAVTTFVTLCYDDDPADYTHQGE